MTLLNRYIAQHGKRLFGLCLTLTGEREAAEDLYQETWLRVCERIGQYRPDMPFEPWLTGICVNLYRDALRHKSRSPFTDAFADNEDKDSAMERVAAPEREDYTDLRAAIDRLPEKLRTAVILYYFHDQDIPAAAKTLRVPRGTVKSRLFKAKNLLRKELSDESLPL